jgi:tRNA threonylcarbamoyladenosine biosynthesis protein TsaB
MQPLSDLWARPLPRLLAFDTSTELLALAVTGPLGCFTEQLPGGAQASAQLLPRAQALLARAGLGLQQLDAIAFGCGPGAFTGLRTSCAVAQGLGWGLGRPLLPLDSLLIVAEDAAAQALAPAGFDVLVAVDARMGEAYVGRYQHGPAGWQGLQPPCLMSLQALADHLAQAQAGTAAGAGPMPWVAGSAWALLQPPPLPGLRGVPAEADRAQALARLALAAWHAGAGIDPAQALPVYLRDKVAQTSAERQALKLQGGPGRLQEAS